MSGMMLNFAGVSAASLPGAPTIGTATATGSSTASVAYTAPVSDGGSTILSYTAVSSPAGGTGTLNQAGSGTINVTGLTAATSYTFTVRATNAIGQGPASAASNSITTDAIAFATQMNVGGSSQTQEIKNDCPACKLDIWYKDGYYKHQKYNCGFQGIRKNV